MINLKVNAVDQPVVVTRPLAQAQGLAERVRANGRHAVIFPLLEIHPVTDPGTLKAALAQLEQYALVAFVSPNAIGAAFAARPDWPLQVPLAVMGEGSRHALAQFGVTDATTTIFRPSDVRNTDSLTLFAELDLAALKGREVLIIRGDGGREFLADALRSAGVNVTQIAAYRRQAPVLDAAGFEELTGTVHQLDDHQFRGPAHSAENGAGSGRRSRSGPTAGAKIDRAPPTNCRNSAKLWF